MKILNAIDQNDKTILYRMAEAGKDKAVELLGKIESSTPSVVSQNLIKAAILQKAVTEGKDE